MSISSPGGGGVGFYSASEIIDPGILINVSVFTDRPEVQYGHTWVEVGLCEEPYSEGSRKLCLITDYLSADNPLAWHGFLPLEKSSLIYLKARGNLNPMIKVFTHRLTKTFARNLMELYGSASH